ncbi:MAG TPA: MCE family protein [Streptosporangiaceae bacterium]|nr:MCE family protein [Streptosporangiaceae bacterium]
MNHSRTKTRRRLGGVAFLVTGALLVWLSVALYDKQFTPVAMVTVLTGSAGNEMHPGAQVMVRGVAVGEVRTVSADGSGARLELAMQPAELSELPANVSAEMLPTTLFGERYVDLVLPDRPVAARLANGSVIRQNRSADGLEIEQVLNNLLPMLAAAQPDKLSLTLTALAHGLQGRGKELGQALVDLNAYLQRTNGQLPQLDTDIKRLAGLSRSYTKALPALLAALNDFSVPGRTIARLSFNFAALLANITTASDDLRSFLNANSQNMVGLSADSLSTLQILADYSPEFPCNLADLAGFVPKIDKVLGAGTSEPGLHVRVLIEPSLGAYQANKDAPVYDDNLGPRCYLVPFRGVHLHDGTSQSRASR